VSGDVELPDKFRGSLGEGYGDGLSQDFMVIGSRMWTRPVGSRTGEWRENQNGAKTAIPYSRLVLIDPIYVKSTEELEQETIDGRRTRHLVMDLDYSALAASQDPLAVGITALLSHQESSLKLQIWIDPETLLIQRQVFAIIRFPGASPAALAIQMDYKRYGSPIDPPITAPQSR